MHPADPGPWATVRPGFRTGRGHSRRSLRLRGRVWVDPHFSPFNPAAILVSFRGRVFSPLPGGPHIPVPAGRDVLSRFAIGSGGRLPFHFLPHPHQSPDRSGLCGHLCGAGVGGDRRWLWERGPDGPRRFRRVGALVVDFELGGILASGPIQPPGFALGQPNLRPRDSGFRSGGFGFSHFLPLIPSRFSPSFSTGFIPQSAME